MPTALERESLRVPFSTAFDDLTEIGPVRLRFIGIEYGSLGSLSGPDVCGGGERIAGVLAQCLREAESGVAFLPTCMGLFAMESEDAFALFREVAAGAELLAAYTALGSEVICQAARAFAGGGVGTQRATASLEEDSVISILLGTHAPSDTVVVTLRLDIASSCGEISMPGFVYLLAEPKSFRAALAEVADRANTAA